MTFIDTSAYIAILNPHESHHKKALTIAQSLATKREQLITSHAILGEILTVGSMRYNRQAAIDFVQTILESGTVVILEEQKILEKAFDIFQKIKNKNVSWVDCYSFAIVNEYKITKAFSFDQDFKKYTDLEILN